MTGRSKFALFAIVTTLLVVWHRTRVQRERARAIRAEQERQHRKQEKAA